MSVILSESVILSSSEIEYVIDNSVSSIQSNSSMDSSNIWIYLY